MELKLSGSVSWQQASQLFQDRQVGQLFLSTYDFLKARELKLSVCQTRSAQTSINDIVH